MELTIILNPAHQSLSAFDLDGSGDFSRNARLDLDELSGLERKARLKRLSEQVDSVKQEISGKPKKKKAPVADDEESTTFGSEDTDFETDDPGADADSDEAEGVDSGDAEDEDEDSGDEGDDEDF
jgi:hypothetical protein